MQTQTQKRFFAWGHLSICREPTSIEPAHEWRLNDRSDPVNQRRKRAARKPPSSAPARRMNVAPVLVEHAHGLGGMASLGIGLISVAGWGDPSGELRSKGRIQSMKKMIALGLALTGALAMSGCQTSQQTTGTLAGGAIGAGSGALIGSAVSGGSAGGAIAGGVIGAGTGALIGNAVTAPPRRCAQWGWDANGNRVCTAFY
jgi:hypothetical protein